MSDGQKYNVIYAGAVAGGFDEQTVKQNFVSQLKIPSDKIDRLFSGKRIVLKKSLTKSKAESWQQKLVLIGAEAAIIPFVDTNEEIQALQTDSEDSSLNPKSTANYSQTNLGSSTLDEQQKECSKSNKKASQQSYDLEMEERIRHAHSMIAEQNSTRDSSDNRSGNITKMLLKMTVVFATLLGFLYFYINLID